MRPTSLPVIERSVLMQGFRAAIRSVLGLVPDSPATDIPAAGGAGRTAAGAFDVPRTRTLTGDGFWVELELFNVSRFNYSLIGFSSLMFEKFS